MLIDGERVKWYIEDWTSGKGNEPDDVTLECEFANGEVEYVRLAASAEFVPEEKLQFGENAGGRDGHPAYMEVTLAVIDSTAMREEPQKVIRHSLAQGKDAIETVATYRRYKESRIVLESQDYKWFEDYFAENPRKR